LRTGRTTRSRSDIRAFTHLEPAAEFGYKDELEPIGEVEALAPLPHVPRFARILELMR